MVTSGFYQNASATNLQPSLFTVTTGVSYTSYYAFVSLQGWSHDVSSSLTINTVVKVSGHGVGFFQGSIISTTGNYIQLMTVNYFVNQAFFRKFYDNFYTLSYRVTDQITGLDSSKQAGGGLAPMVSSFGLDPMNTVGTIRNFLIITGFNITLGDTSYQLDL